MSKEVKTSLKEIRQLLNQNDHKEAIKKCKKILREDKNNYVALVLLGVAMQEVEEVKDHVPLPFKRAIEIQPDNPLAWQGLTSYYEKAPDNLATWNELIPAYCKLLCIDSTSTKFSHYLTEATEMALRSKDASILSKVVDTLGQLRNNSSNAKIKLIDESLISILMKIPNAFNDQLDLQINILASASRDANAKHRQEYCKKYLQLLKQQDKLALLLAEAADLHERFSDDPTPLEWICQIYCEQNVAIGEIDGLQIARFYDALLTLVVDSAYALHAKAVHLLKADSVIESRNLLNRVVISKPRWMQAWILLAEVNAKLHCWDEAGNAAQQAIKLFKNKTPEAMQNKIEDLQIEALARGTSKKKWELAVQKCELVISKRPSPKLKLLLARCYVMLDAPTVEDVLHNLESDSETKLESTILRAIHLERQKKFEEAADVLGSALETSEAWLNLGKIHWAMSDYSHSLMAFLKGIHMDTFNWECLVYLGHYYRERGNDLERSRRCYQKALQINPYSEDAGVGLSTAYRLLKNVEANMRLLQCMTSQSGGPKWAWLQLGLQHLDQGEWSEAIHALRFVIRADPNDNHCWESLADAYWARGAYTSALKSYERVLQLNPGSLYPMIQLANIKLVLGQLVEAKEDFERILQLESHNVTALKGLAETCLGLAKEYAGKQLLGRVTDSAQQAVENLVEAILQRNDLSCIWKLLGDACYRVAVLPDRYCHLTVPEELIKIDGQGERVLIQRSKIFQLASWCYCHALRISEDSAMLWHDLACSYLAQLRYDPAVDRVQISSKCLAAVKQAIRLCPSSWMHWNLLGVVCMLEETKNYALSQHSFVTAIDKEPNNAVVWTNLGSLYLILGDLYKANRAFSRAQRSDPAYTNCWVGQSLIAETAARKEAMDLYRHATQLGYQNEAAMGYTHWVLTTLLDPAAKKDPLYKYAIENMHAVTVATDAITWYIEHEPDNVCALNAQGLLLERQKLYRPASKAFSRALALVEEGDKKDAVLVNLARVLLQVGKYQEAVEHCRAVEKASFKSHCQLALSLFKAERFEESYAAYEAALHWLADASSDKGHVLCAMAAMAYMFQGVDDVKTLLFQCILIQPSVVPGLLAAAALGILHGDVNLITLVLKELQSHRDHPDHRHHIVRLMAYSKLAQNDVQGAVRDLCRAAYVCPDDTESWIGLVRILWEVGSSSLGSCAEKALFLGRNTSTLGVAHIACVSSLDKLPRGLSKEEIRSVQKTLFAFPGTVSSWALFIAALLPRCGHANSWPNAKWLATLISIVRKTMELTRPMNDWLSNNERKTCIMAERLSAA
ncbi:tetratricopeptide repeat protein 37 [Orussus abietinus]|uniref:tetratricopeptide repeat protein 37 n=1 Tax=Orussus abietinus TaxID=222816 RepID=UPI000C715DCF|nr:tetratricopeptide repeat protein 37 [Orussus abietinus]XP_023290659.1 tetratricopeptide repeat protein 37 [Orussus abietinus]XP_023290660.1 tetratricopeptide repeat protein 37 [Orussus abietinus]